MSHEDPITIDSESVGDPTRFLALELLEQGLAALPAAPRDAGRVVLLVRRAANGRRETPERVRLTPGSGFPGDAWGRRPEPAPEAQLTAMQLDVALLIANGQPLALSGDNLFLDLDLSAANLPIGSRLRAGSVTFEVTPKPHNGCQKFRARFGGDALRFVARRELRHLNLRGIYLMAVEGGDLVTDDRIEVLSRVPGS